MTGETKMRSAGKAKVLTEAEFNRVVAIQKSNTRTGQRNLLMLHLSFYLGLRVKEIAGLSIHDVMDANNEVREEITLTVTKGNRIRQAYLSNPKLVTLIKRYKCRRRLHKVI